MTAVAAVLIGAVAAVLSATAPPVQAIAAGTTASVRGATASSSQNPLITVRGIDRDGKQVPIDVTLEEPYSASYTLTSARPVRVPKGTYVAVTWVQGLEDPPSNTLVDRVLVVGKSETVTFDARPGRPIEFNVDDSTVQDVMVAAELYAPGVISDQRAAPTPAYAIPGKLPSGYTLLLESSLYQFGANPSPVNYVLLRKLTGSIPANLTFSYHRSQLALVQVTARAIDKGEYPAGTDTVSVNPVVPGYGGYIPPAQQSGATPFSVDYYLSPGYSWGIGTVAGSDWARTSVLGARSYSETLNQAVYGPSPDFGPMVDGDQLEMSWGLGEYLLVPPGQLDSAVEPSTQAWLYRGSKLLVREANRGFTVTIPAKPAWYTLRMQVNRDGWLGASWTPLFASETDTFNFRAQAGDDDLASTNFWPELLPVGLNWDNAEPAGTNSTVRISFKSLKGVVAAHNVKVWSSADGGKTWTPLHPTTSGAGWDVVVTNPSTPGYMALKVQGSNAEGFTASVAVTRAYAVS